VTELAGSVPIVIRPLELLWLTALTTLAVAFENLVSRNLESVSMLGVSNHSNSGR